MYTIFFNSYKSFHHGTIIILAKYTWISISIGTMLARDTFPIQSNIVISL